MEQIRSAPMAGKTLLVTGASGGIGRATALGLTTTAYSGGSHGCPQCYPPELRADL